MSINSRFAVAVHLLTGLALYQNTGLPTTSEIAAESVNTNPVVVRRIFGALREAGLVTSQPGVGGGWQFVRSPEKITLRDVYRAVQDEALLSLHQRSPNMECPIGHSILATLEGHFERAESALENELAQVTIADVYGQVLARSKAAGLLTPLECGAASMVSLKRLPH